MPRFFAFLAKNYDPSNVDQGMFAMHVAAPHAVPLIATSEVDPRFGTATVDGKPVSKGKCVKFDFSPLPFYFVPVGEVAREFGKTYTVRLTGFRSKKGKKFAPCTFRLTTDARGTDDGKHKENEAAAKEVSDEGIVLLKNDGTLPLAVGESVSLLGAYQDFRISAVGASLIKPRWQFTLEEALVQCASFKLSENADTALYIISRRSGENQDNKPIAGEYYLTEREKAELSSTVKIYKRVILILNTGYPVEMKFISSLSLSAIIWTGFCGQRGTESLADILCGRVNPSGRLADTWPYDYYDTPAAHNFVNQDENTPVYSDDGKKQGVRVFYEEEQFVGYRYFDTFQNKSGGQFDGNRNGAAYLFGHGLSYTTFSVSAKAAWESGVLKISTRIESVGTRAGKNAFLVYVASPAGRLKKPVRTFAGFEKTRLLSPGEKETLTIEIPAKDFAVYDDKARAFVLEAGEYIIFAGGSISDAEKIGSFALEKELTVEKTCSVLAPVEEVRGISADGTVRERTQMVPRSKVFPVQAAYQKSAAELSVYHGTRILFSDVKAHPEKLDDFVSQFSLKELVDFTVCNGSCFGSKQSGAAGKLAHSEKYGVPTYYMSDGNCSVNLNRRTTGFPSSNVLAGTFNKQLAYMVGEVLAKESKEYGIAINLGPGGNLHRNLLCGRHSEYFSEDPVLAGTMMAYQARGQEENGVRATYKHFLANGSELERKSSHSIMNERTLRELHLRVFDKAFSLYKPSCVMTSYNSVNGIYPSESAPLLHDLLRKCWGLDGFIMTDWGACDTADAVRSVNAGTDLLTPGDKKLFKKIYSAAKRGEISKGTLQNSVKQIIKVLLQCE